MDDKHKEANAHINANQVAHKMLYKMLETFWRTFNKSIDRMNENLHRFEVFDRRILFATQRLLMIRELNKREQVTRNSGMNTEGGYEIVNGDYTLVPDGTIDFLENEIQNLTKERNYLLKKKEKVNDQVNSAVAKVTVTFENKIAEMTSVIQQLEKELSTSEKRYEDKANRCEELKHQLEKAERDIANELEGLHELQTKYKLALREVERDKHITINHLTESYEEKLAEVNFANAQLREENVRLKVQAKQIENHIARDQKQRSEQDADRFDSAQKKLSEKDSEIMELKKELESKRKVIEQLKNAANSKNRVDQTPTTTPPKITTHTTPPDVRDILENYSSLTQQLGAHDEDEYL
jgi:uncharacterized phage infection (PIP) family protein YhgE